MINDTVLFDSFGLDYLEGRGVLSTASGVDLVEFLKSDLSFVNEEELLNVVGTKVLDSFEKKMVSFWAAFLKSKKLFEKSIGCALSVENFEFNLERITSSYDFNLSFSYINWTNMFLKAKVLKVTHIANFYENVAISMAKKGSLTIDLVNKFEECGIMWDSSDVHDKTVLIYLCDEHPELNLLTCILSKGTDVNIRGLENYTAFMILCQNEELTIDMLELFLNNGADMDVEGELGWTSFMLLCANTSVTLGMIKLFVEKGVDLNKQTNTGLDAFIILCENVNVTLDMIKVFIDGGVNINNSDSNGTTAFGILCEDTDMTLDMIKLFIEAGVDLNKQDKYGQTSFMLLCSRETVTLEKLKLFFDYNLDISIQDSDGDSAFMMLCGNEAVTLDMVKLFIDNGVDIKTTNRIGSTALNKYSPVGSDSLEILKLLGMI